MEDIHRPGQFFFSVEITGCTLSAKFSIHTSHTHIHTNIKVEHTECQ